MSLAFEVELPRVGESITEGVIGKWLVSEGDRVCTYDPLVEIITDKVNMEMPSPVTGVVTKIVAMEGDVMPVGAIIAEIEADDVEIVADSKPADTLGSLIQGVAVGPTGASNVPQELTDSESLKVTSSDTQALEKSDLGLSVKAKRTRYSPAVRRLAKEHGIDLSLVRGTGIGGRVSRKDLNRYIQTVIHKNDGVVPQALDGDRLPVSSVRKMIADNMVKSAGEIPHAWGMVEVDVSGLVELREKVKDEFKASHGHTITYLPFAISAVAAALQHHPMINSSWAGNEIIQHRVINIGFAVAAVDGLIVPVVREAVSLSLTELAGEIDRLIIGARNKGLKPYDVRDGTFTVNNTGALGSVASGPIIVPGQAGILTTETIVKRPVVVDSDAIEARWIMNLCMSFDHRILDGADAAAFLKSVKMVVEGIGLNTDLKGPLVLGQQFHK